MNPVTKFEAVGIFLSVAVMAIALVLIRFNTDTFATTLESAESESQVGTVVVASDETTIEDRITDSVGIDGKLNDLVVDDVRVGTGKSVVSGDTITVHYKGTLRDGTQFDSSYLRGEPYTFTIGTGKVIEGWDTGLLGMKVGGERILVVPPEMAYGNAQVGVIPAQSPLIFAVELLKIN